MSGKIKHTKNELKTQRENLQRFQRFLPMLQLKKQLLQAEIQHVLTAIHDVEKQVGSLRDRLSSWIALFADPIEPADYLAVETVRLTEGNVAGVPVPVFERVEFERRLPDLFATPSWIDDALAVLEEWLTLHEQKKVLHEQERLIRAELVTTSQRVNLFEKVKIPETNENIRVIKIFLGDEQTAAVARAKTAKDRLRR